MLDQLLDKFRNRQIDKRKYYKLTALVCAAVVLIYILSLLTASWREGRLIDQYLMNRETMRFATMLLTDRKDLDANPDKYKRVAVTMDMGLQWYNLKEYGLAVKWWKKGLKLEPNNYLGWYNLGNGYKELGKYTKAEDAYVEGMRIARSGETEACLALGELYKYNYPTKKNKENNVYLQCLIKHKDNWDLLAHLAGYYRDTGDLKRAMQYFDKLFSIAPTPEISQEISDLRQRMAEEEMGKKRIK